MWCHRDWIVLDCMGVVFEECSRNGVIEADRMRFVILTLSGWYSFLLIYVWWDADWLMNEVTDWMVECIKWFFFYLSCSPGEQIPAFRDSRSISEPTRNLEDMVWLNPKYSKYNRLIGTCTWSIGQLLYYSPYREETINANVHLGEKSPVEWDFQFLTDQGIRL